MRLITIRTPAGDGKRIAEIAFKKGIKEVAISTAYVYRSGEAVITQDVLNIETSTPKAKSFIDAFMAAPIYDPVAYSFTVRHPESIFGAEPPEEEIHPIIRPTTDVYEELYQFTKVTVSLAGRVFLSSILLSFGLIDNNLPLIIAGLLFLPYHHHMIALALGGIMKEWRFLRQAALALLISTVLIFLAGVCVAMVCKPPILFEPKGSILSGIVLAAVIGVAAGLGSIDDAGRRELIGLAVTAHISVYPALIGLQVVFGEAANGKVMEHLLSLLINVTVLVFAAILTYAIAGMRGDGIRRFIYELTQKKSK